MRASDRAPHSSLRQARVVLEDISSRDGCAFYSGEGTADGYRGLAPTRPVIVRPIGRAC